MKCAEYTLTDNKYRSLDESLPNPLPETVGLSNAIVTLDNGEESDERFVHNGVTGYPTTHTWMVEKDGKVLALFDGTPDEGGTEIAKADVLAKLVSDYGFPPETTMGVDGLPVVPEIAA